MSACTCSFKNLEDRGMRVRWQPPDVGRSGALPPGTQQYVVDIAADGTLGDMGMAIEGMRRRAPLAKAEVQDDEDHDERPAPDV